MLGWPFVEVVVPEVLELPEIPVVGHVLEAAGHGNVRQPPQVLEEASLQVQLQVLEGAVDELQEQPSLQEAPAGAAHEDLEEQGRPHACWFQESCSGLP